MADETVPWDDYMRLRQVAEYLHAELETIDATVCPGGTITGPDEAVKQCHVTEHHMPVLPEVLTNARSELPSLDRIHRPDYLRPQPS